MRKSPGREEDSGRHRTPKKEIGEEMTFNEWWNKTGSEYIIKCQESHGAYDLAVAAWEAANQSRIAIIETTNTNEVAQ